ncbi:Alanine--tRNA ligase [Forsythia ovata]|uniref:Alanine--tRNA ligase n=1 Tax=Forsythia ovata TaxID=205694 RepID=A0ABD1SLW2_9LAMI
MATVNEELKDLVHSSVIKAIYTGEEFVESVDVDAEVGIILETTNFHTEQDGQVDYDRRKLTAATQTRFGRSGSGSGSELNWFWELFGPKIWLKLKNNLTTSAFLR